jgi:hypothetical protein
MHAFAQQITGPRTKSFGGEIPTPLYFCSGYGLTFYLSGKITNGNLDQNPHFYTHATFRAVNNKEMAQARKWPYLTPLAPN